jgi:hypothetical protein
MADAQDDPTHELAWDLRALEAAQRCSEAEASAYHESLSMAGFMPSLHLNLADVYRRLGDHCHSMQEASASPLWVSFAPQPPLPGYSDAAAK